MRKNMTNPCAPAPCDDEQYTAYQLNAVKFVCHGRITIQGERADTLEGAQANLDAAMAEYLATGAWGGGRG